MWDSNSGKYIIKAVKSYIKKNLTKYILKKQSVPFSSAFYYSHVEPHYILYRIEITSQAFKKT